MNKERLLISLELREILSKTLEFNYLCKKCQRKTKENLEKIIKEIDKLLKRR